MASEAGICPQLSDAELVTLAVMQALLGLTSEARWGRYAHNHLRHLFPYLPQQPGYNKRLRWAAALIWHCIRVLAASQHHRTICLVITLTNRAGADMSDTPKNADQPANV